MTNSHTAAQAAFEVTVQPSGRHFSATADEIVLEAAIRQGIGLPYGCKDGACGSCKCRLISGKVQMDEFQSHALTEDEQAQGYVLTCKSRATENIVLESHQVTSANTIAIKKMPARVSSLSRLADDVMVLNLQLPSNEKFVYHAGQYVEIHVPGGKKRSYSMASAPHHEHKMELHIRHMPGGQFTDHVFSDMKEKEILRIEGPYGSFFLREDSEKPMILLASGTGFAPAKAILEHMQHKGIKRQTHLYWGARRPKDLYMESWLKQQCERMHHLQYVPVISDALPEDAWSGRSGLVHKALMQDFADLSGYQVYACGAPVMVESARHDLTTMCSLPEEEFFSDAFTSEKDKHKT